MKCKHLKYRSRKGKIIIYCSLLRKEISYSCCQECDNKEYKELKPLKKRTNKQNKKEKERFSIIYPDLTKCCKCGLKSGQYDKRINDYTRVDKNEVFEGSFRQVSIRLGMITPFCTYCHKLFHKDIFFNLQYKVMFQREYMRKHSLEEFIDSFGQNYIFKLEQKKRGKDI